MIIQRGLATLPGGATSIIIDLETPVPIGKSYPVNTTRHNDISAAGAFCTVTLTGEEDGHYTTLTIERETGSGTVSVSWEVVTGAQFSVQTGVKTVSGNSVSSVLLPIDTTKAFPVVSFRTAGAFRAEQFLVRAELSETSITLRRYSTSTSSNVIARYYVVEMEGATVATGEATIGYNSLSVTVNVPEIALENTFLTFGWSGAIFNMIPGLAAVEGRVLSNTQLQFLRGNVSEGDAAALTIRWYLVQHDKIRVQRGREQTTGTTAINVGIDYLKPERSFVVASSSSTGGTTSYYQSALATVVLTSSVNIEVKRDRGGGSVYTSWFVIEWIAATPPEGLSPDGVAVMPEEANTFSFALADAENPQGQELRYRELGAAAWIELGREAYTGKHLFAENTFEVGKDYEWQVRYWEAGEIDPSDWSVIAKFNTYNPVIQSPTPLPGGSTQTGIQDLGARLKSPYGRSIQLIILIANNSDFANPITYSLPPVESGELAIIEHAVQGGGTWYVRMTATDTESMQTVLEYSFFAGEFKKWIGFPEVTTQGPQATHITVRIRGTTTEYTAHITPEPPPSQRIERLVLLDTGDLNTCVAVANELLSKWGREQISIKGEIPLTFTLRYKQKVRVVIPEAGIARELILQKKKHLVIPEAKTQVELGDISLSQNELIARVIDSLDRKAFAYASSFSALQTDLQILGVEQSEQEIANLEQGQELSDTDIQLIQMEQEVSPSE